MSRVSRYEVALVQRAILGVPYVFGGKGMEKWAPVKPLPLPLLALDCSGNIGYCIWKAGGTDLRWTHSADTYLTELPRIELAAAKPMDVCLYGTMSEKLGRAVADHIMFWAGDGTGRVVGACGAGTENNSLQAALTNISTQRNDGRVQYRPKPDYRADFLGVFSMEEYLA
jgi:hypothetical protein